MVVLGHIEKKIFFSLGVPWEKSKGRKAEVCHDVTFDRKYIRGSFLRRWKALGVVYLYKMIAWIFVEKRGFLFMVKIHGS